MGLYAPNNQQASFWNDLCLMLLYNGPNNLILFMGIFNSVLHVNLDRCRETGTFGLSGLLLQFKQDFQLVDVWRQQNQMMQDFTHYYSHRHEIYAHIDKIWVSQQIAAQTVLFEIENCILLSDHAPVNYLAMYLPRG